MKAVGGKTMVSTGATAAETGTILIRKLQARCIIGIRGWERRRKQKVRLDVAFAADLAPAAASDRITDSVDYKQVKDRILGHVESSRFQLLEALAASVADLVLEDPRVSAVDVTVDKPKALSGAKSVAVRIQRSRAGPGRQRGV